MTRVILPVRSRRPRPTSSASTGTTPSTDNPGVASTQPMINRPAENNSGLASQSTPKEGNQDFQTLVPSIEQNLSPSFTFEPDSSHSPVMTPTLSISDVAPQGDGPSNARKINNSPIFNFLGQRSPKPSVTTSPPPSVSAATRSSVAASEVENTGLTPGVQNLSLESRQSPQQHTASLEMGELSSAIDDIVRNADTSRFGGSLTVSSPGLARRRSSPRPEPVIHNVEDEDPPDDEFHHPDFQRRLSQTKNMLQNLASVLASSSIVLDPDSSIKAYHEKAETLSQFHPLSKRKIGLVGDSGVGKSSLVNSLLDTCKPPLARATGGGKACTCVVTEYHFHAGGDFVIDVEMFSAYELYEQLSELLGSYRAFKTGDKEESKKAQLAMDTFRSMFRGKLRDEEWILSAPEAVVLDNFKMWAKEARRLGPPARKVVQTIEQCSSWLTPLTSERKDPNLNSTPSRSQSPTPNPPHFSLWPYIRKIKVYLKSHVLSKGLILVDLPGLRDLNSARQKITQQYLWHCHEIFAVCETKRAATDAGVKTVFALAQQAKRERIGIIATHSDVFNWNDDWEHGDPTRINELNRSLHAVELEIEDNKRELTTFDHLHSEDDATREIRWELQTQQIRLVAQRDTIKLDRLEYAVRTRNSDVTQSLRVEYQGQTQGQTLHVFCVSNQLYESKRNQDNSVSRRYIRLSGIIELRRHLIAIVGESQLRASKRFLERKVPILLHNIELWVQSGARSSSADEKQAVRDLLGKVEDYLGKSMTSRRTTPLETIRRSLENSFQTRIWEGRNISKWTKSSKDACKEWEKWDPASYAAWLRHDGEWTTEAEQYRNWNMEVMQAMAADVESPWNDLLSDIRTHQLSLKQCLGACWDAAIVLLESEWPASNDQVDEVGRALEARKHLLFDKADDRIESFNDCVSLLRIDTLTWLNGSAITRIMSNTCREALEYEGRGCTKPRRKRVRQTFADEATFEGIMRELRNCFKDHVQGLQQELGKLVSTNLDAIRDTLDIVREENAAEESERDPEFRQRVADEVARSRSLMGL